MSEYKKMSEWANEIGLVPGMIFSFGENSDSTLHIINVDNNRIKFYFNFSLTHKSIDKMCNIQDFDDKYNLIYDPRNDVKNDTKESIQKEILKKESELATLKEKLKELNKFKFEVGKVYIVIFDHHAYFGYIDGNCFNNFGNKFYIQYKHTCIYISNHDHEEKLETVYEILGNPTLSDLVFGTYKISENLLKKEN